MRLSKSHREAQTMVVVGVHRDPRHPRLHLLHPADPRLLPRLSPPPLYEPDHPPCPPAWPSLPRALVTASQVGRLVPRVDQAAVILHWTRGLTETSSDDPHAM